MIEPMYLLIGHFNPEFTRYFEAHNIAYYIIKDQKRHYQNDAHSVVVDFTDKQAVYQAVDNLPTRPTCVFSMYEQYIPITAEINQYLGLNHALSPEAARASTDKILMRQAFARAPEPISPPFALVETAEQAVAFAQKHGFPLILKPANLSKSLLITRCDSMEELQAAWQEAMVEAPRLYEQFTDGLKPRFILERFMPGSVHTVLGFADKDGNVTLAKEIVDNVTAQEAGFDDSFIFSRTIPSRLPIHDQEALLHCSRLGMEALGLRSCAAHIELVMTNEGARLIEIGARVGGYRTVMYREASGIDVIGASLQAYCGELPNLTAQKRAYYRAIELFPPRKGSFVEAPYFDTAAKLPSVLSARLKCKPGDLIGKASEGFKAAIVIELASESEDQINNDYRFIQENVSVTVA